MQHGQDATEYSVASHPLQQLDFDWNPPISTKSLDQVQCHATESLMTPCQILHATKSLAIPCLILHATVFFATPCLFLGTLFHVLKVLAIETKSQKLISYTSGVAHAKVITTGETTTPSLLVTALPSMDDFIAGDSHAHDLL